MWYSHRNLYRLREAHSDETAKFKGLEYEIDRRTTVFSQLEGHGMLQDIYTGKAVKIKKRMSRNKNVHGRVTC